MGQANHRRRQQRQADLESGHAAKKRRSFFYHLHARQGGGNHNREQSMNEPETLDRPVPKPVPAGAPRLKLRFPFICLLVYWVAFFVVGAFNKPYFFGFLYGMASVLVVTLLLFGWWWLNRGLRVWEKCAGF